MATTTKKRLSKRKTAAGNGRATAKKRRRKESCGTSPINTATVNKILNAFDFFEIFPGYEGTPKAAKALPQPPVRRGGRRSRIEIQRIRAAIYNLLAAEQPMTVRQVFYRLVSLGTIDKTEAEYKSTVCRLLARMRRDGEIPFSWVADNTRWMRKPDSYSSMSEMLESQQRFYRRSLWDNQNTYVEVWLEKDALAGVLLEVTAEWDVPLMVTRGYPSLSFLYSAAETIAGQKKPSHLYYFGDHDPSGVHIPRKVESDLRTFAPDAEIHFQRVAVTPEQIETLRLPTRPTKKTDSRSKSFTGESVEADAIPPATLRTMVSECITQHIDREALDRMKTIENAERETLGRIVECVQEMDD